MSKIITSNKRNNRRYPGVKGVRPDLKEFRRNETEERVKFWQSLSYEKQLSELDRRGVVAKRQRIRIEKKINKDKDSKTEVKDKPNE